MAADEPAMDEPADDDETGYVSDGERKWVCKDRDETTTVDPGDGGGDEQTTDPGYDYGQADRYFMFNGANDYLEVEHTDDLLLGDNDADFTVSFDYATFYEQTEKELKVIVHKGNTDQERTPAIW